MVKAREKQLESLSNTEIKRLINEYIHNKRDRDILVERLIDGICYEPLAEKYGLSVRHVKTIVYNGESKVFSHIGK
jgi:hypothetical protein